MIKSVGNVRGQSRKLRIDSIYNVNPLRGNRNYVNLNKEGHVGKRKFVCNQQESSICRNITRVDTTSAQGLKKIADVAAFYPDDNPRHNLKGTRTLFF